MNKIPTISDAIETLGINGGWKCKDGKIVKWYSEKPQPSDEIIEGKLKELQDDYDAKEYQRKREPEYPNIGDQLDMIYWDKKNSTDLWKEAIDKVKSDNPKP